MNEKIMAALGFRECEIASIKDGRCPLCDTDVAPTENQSELDREEFLIAVLCRECRWRALGV